MSGYCYKKSYELRYSDFDFKDELKLSSLLAVVQEAACWSADELGFGYEALKPKGFGFITVNTYGELLAPIAPGDTLTVETWPLPPRHVIFERDYRVCNQRGEPVSRLASRWCLVDLATFSLLLPDALGEVHARCPYRSERTVEVPSWKIPKLGADKREVYSMTVRNSVCDHYFHANNTRYADFFLDCYPMEEQRAIKSFQVAYVKQAKEGKELRLFRGEGETDGVCEAFCGDELAAQFRVGFAGGQ